jgi:hypothetical protein
MQFGDWVGIAVGVLLFAVGIPVGVLLGRRNRQKPDLRVASDFDQVVQPGHWLLRGGLVVTFDGHALDRVSRTYVAFWNHRGDTVSGADALAADPLRIEVASGDSVHQVRLVAFSRSQNALRATVSDEGARVHFDFLDAGDGGVFEVLHHGTEPARIVGTIPGASIAKPRDAILAYESRTRISKSRFRRIVSARDSKSFFTIQLFGIATIVALVTPSVGRLIPSLSPELVNISNYDLSTLDGQVAFAGKVSLVGGSDTFTQILDVATIALAVFCAAGVIAFGTGSNIPRSIVAIDI